MKNRRLLRCIGQIDDDLILEAACVRFSSRKRKLFLEAAVGLALAACLGLVIALPQFFSGQPNPDAQLTDHALTDPAPEHHSPFSFDGLSLDMTQEQVLALLGEPEQITEEDNPRWFYPTVTVQFHSFDQKVCNIWLLKGCELTLPNGIGIGSVEETIQELYPDDPMMRDYSKTSYLQGAFIGDIEGYTDRAEDALYQINTEELSMQLGVHDGSVEFIFMRRFEDPMLKALTADPITIYTPVDAGRSWHSVTVTGKAAKGICTVLTISEPEEPSDEKTDFIYWLDFGNGTALELYGNDNAAIYSYSGDALDPSRTDGLSWRLSGRFPDLDTYVLRALESTDDAPALLSIFPQLNKETLTAYTEMHPELLSDGWDHLYLNEAGLEDGGTELYTIQGDQVLAIDAQNEILLLRVQEQDYRGVLAIVNDPKKLSLQITSQPDVSGEYVGDIAAAHNGILAINAGPLAPNDDGTGDASSLYGYIMSNGTAYNTDAHLQDGQTRLEIDAEGKFYLTDTQAPVSDGTYNAVEAPYALIKDGSIVADENITGPHPRTCIGQTTSGQVLMLVIEGRLEDSLGAGLPECAKILQRYDCENALNLLQGTASIVWFDGEYVTRCSNRALPQGRLLPAAFVIGRSN